VYVFRGGVIEVDEEGLVADCKYGKWRLTRDRLEWSISGPPPPVDWRVPQPLADGLQILVEYLLSACEYRWHSGERAVVALAGPPGSGKTTYFTRLLGRQYGDVGIHSVDVYVEGRPVTLYDLPGHRELSALPERPDGVLAFVPLDELMFESAWYLLAVVPKAVAVVGTKADVGRTELLNDYVEYFKVIGINVAASYAITTPDEPRWRLAEILTTIVNAL